MNDVDITYFKLLQTIVKEGRLKKNRTGIDTIGIFGAQAKFSVDYGAFPILTTKKVHFKSIVHELLWFIKGDTNIKYLVDNGVHIWDEWAYARYKKSMPTEFVNFTQEEFIQRIKEDDLFAKNWGELGEGTYGGMWRAFPYYTPPVWYEDDDEKCANVQSVDQIQKILDKLKTNPDDRRMIVSAWHPYWVDHCALPPCHCLFHFNTEELNLSERIDLDIIQCQAKNEIPFQRICFDEDFYEVKYHKLLDEAGIPRRRVNLLLYQRSCDTFLGVPFNITSYSLLLAMVAHCVNMVPGVFTHTYGDLHIYTNHKDQIKEQMRREPRKLPRLWLNPDKRNLFDFTYDDIKLVDYDPHPAIKAEVAV